MCQSPGRSVSHGAAAKLVWNDASESMRGVIACCSLLLSASVARADVLSLVLDGGSAPPASTPSGATPSEPNDLISWAGEPKAITLPELLNIAIQQAPALKSAKLDIAVAEAQIAETWARHDWTVTVVATGQHTGAAIFSGIPISGTTNYGVTADIARVLPTGGTLDFHASSQYSDTGIAIPGVPTSSYWNDVASVSLNQPLLKNRGSDYYNALERKADLSRDAAVLARRLAALQTVQTVISDYWDLVLAEQQVAITEASLAVANERLRVTQLQVSSGRSAQSEIPAVEQTIATTEEQVFTGELAVLDASLALRRAVGMAMGAGDLGLRVSTDLEARDNPLDLAALIQRTYDASPELAQLSKQDASATIDVFVNDNGLLPQLDLALSVGQNVTDNTFGATAKDLVTVDAYQISGQLTFSRSLRQYDVRYRSTELRNAREKIRVNAVDVRAQLAQAMSHSVAAIQLAKRRVVLDDRAVALAKENVRIETDRFNVGRSTNFDVMLRLDEQRQAELRKVQAQIDWHKAETMMLMLTGDLLPMFGITVP
jgi:outer membrane protein